MAKSIIQTSKAPKAIGTYSQAVKIDRTVYISGQIPLDPNTLDLIEGNIRAQITQVFENLRAVAIAAEGNLSDIVKLNVYLTDLSNFPIINEVMGQYFQLPYPARAVIGVASLPKNAQVEMDAVMILQEQEYY